ncbi:MAG: tRNA lysidine(34) synthetase TilS [Proteobacteria bacterium]|nr:tRNA lysidine(34) synthetase TilS [Pseudomonadota bacterium]
MTHVSENLADRLRQVLAAHLADPRRSRYCVAFSGGLDSSVLLALMTAIVAEWPDAALRAIHVNHGLYADADRWQSAAQAVAQKLAVDFSAIRVAVAEDAQGGVEAAARDARYRALADVMVAGEVLVCAHHLDDQLETFLLQLMRGAGLAGLAAMPVVRDLGPGLLLRPLLSVSRDELCDWARQNAVDWCEDSSNQDQQFARNYLRHRILPLLRERWPTVAGSVARSAAHCAEAESVLAELAEQDLGEPLADTAYLAAVLSTEKFDGLSAGRVRNLLRYWIRSRGYPVPGHGRLAEIIDGVVHARPDAKPVVRWRDTELRRYRDKLYLMAPLGEAPDQVLAWDTDKPLALPGAMGRLELAPADSACGDGAMAERLLDGMAPVRVWRQHRGLTARALAAKAGIDLRTMVEVVRMGGAGNFFTDRMVEGINQRGRPTQFSLALAAKDAGLLLDVARESAVPMPVAAEIAQVFVAALGAGLGERDWSDLVELIERQANVKLELPPPRTQAD